MLAVGDEGFTHKCLDKFGEFKRRGKTILLVTHSLGLVERFCDEALWLDSGKVRGSGDPKRVVGAYLTDVGKSEERELARAEARAQDSRAVEVPDADDAESRCRSKSTGGLARRRHDAGGRRTMGLARDGNHRGDAKNDSGEVVAHLSVRRTDVDSPEGARASAERRFRVRHRHLQRRGRQLLRHEHALEEFTPQEIRGEGEVTFAIERLDLVEGTYKLDVAVHKRDGTRTTITGCCTPSA